MLLLLRVAHLWKHFLDPRVVSGLNQHPCLIVLIYTAVSNVSDVNIGSHTCLFHTVSHVEGLLACIS